MEDWMVQAVAWLVGVGIVLFLVRSYLGKQVDKVYSGYSYFLHEHGMSMSTAEDTLLKVIHPNLVKYTKAQRKDVRAQLKKAIKNKVIHEIKIFIDGEYNVRYYETTEELFTLRSWLISHKWWIALLGLLPLAKYRVIDVQLRAHYGLNG